MQFFLKKVSNFDSWQFDQNRFHTSQFDPDYFSPSHFHSGQVGLSKYLLSGSVCFRFVLSNLVRVWSRSIWSCLVWFKLRILIAYVHEIQTASVVICSSHAKRLKETNSIKIPWVNCKIRVRINIKNYYHCWETWYIAANCQGSNREQLCRKCDKKAEAYKGEAA